jgi:hypothetical protein
MAIGVFGQDADTLLRNLGVGLATPRPSASVSRGAHPFCPVPSGSFSQLPR